VLVKSFSSPDCCTSELWSLLRFIEVAVAWSLPPLTLFLRVLLALPRTVLLFPFFQSYAVLSLARGVRVRDEFHFFRNFSSITLCRITGRHLLFCSEIIFDPCAGAMFLFSPSLPPFRDLLQSLLQSLHYVSERFIYGLPDCLPFALNSPWKCPFKSLLPILQVHRLDVRSLLEYRSPLYLFVTAFARLA